VASSSGARGGEAHDGAAQGRLGPGVEHDPSTDDLYERLQVSPRATLGVIRAAYRTLARDYHPDVNATPEAARYMLHLNEAYDILSDPIRRARYHRRYEQAAPGPVRRAPGRTARSAQVNRTHRRSHTSQPWTAHLDRSTGSPLLMRATVAALAVAAITLVLLFAWIAFEELDDQPPATFGPRSRSATGTGSFNLCGPGRVIPLTC
jgi:curved DNA-binding protein CbpA